MPETQTVDYDSLAKKFGATSSTPAPVPAATAAGQTGTQQLWVAELPASAHVAPITYKGKKSGKQFVVIAAGGGGFFRGDTANEVVAYALP